ncbi:ATP-binding cassette domain-containing protein [Latilactobacillus sp. VITA-14]|uniref:ATP-binding cassette domain-containing protein n=1 Tax=Latilactobacillus sp. VITA-14 TaxID=3367745 RepID=UPI0039819B06
MKNINVDIPLNQFVAISGPSGSGKSSLAMGILYAEGSRRYLETLSTYTRRRITQNKRSQAQEVRHIPSAIALGLHLGNDQVCHQNGQLLVR